MSYAYNNGSKADNKKHVNNAVRYIGRIIRYIVDSDIDNDYLKQAIIPEYEYIENTNTIVGINMYIFTGGHTKFKQYFKTAYDDYRLYTPDCASIHKYELMSIKGGD